MKRFLMYAVLAVALTATSALGDVLSGMRLGLTFGMLEAENAPPLNTGYGLSIGFILANALSTHFCFVSEINMTDMGLGYYENGNGEEVSIRNGAITVPLTIRFQVTDAFPLYLAAGGQIELPFYPKAKIGDKGYAINSRSVADVGATAGIGYRIKGDANGALNVDVRYVYNLTSPFDEKLRGGAGKNSFSCVWVGVSIGDGLYMTETRAERNARQKAEADEREARRKAMEERDAEREARVRANPTGFAPPSETRSETEQILLESGMIVLDAVYFETGKAEIHRNSKPYLTTIAKMLVKYPKLRLEIGGHTDNTGSQQVNMTLSQKRADAVSEFMRDVEPSLSEMLSAKGYGPTEPKADNNTADGRETNRRVELKVLNPDVLAEYK